MLKSLLVILAIASGIAFVETASAQRPGETMSLTAGCNQRGCQYNIYTWTYNPTTRRYEWKLTGTQFIPGKDPATIER